MVKSSFKLTGILLIAVIMLTVIACGSPAPPLPNGPDGSGVADSGVPAPRATFTLNPAFAAPAATEVPTTMTPLPTALPTAEPTATPEPVGESTLYQNDVLGLGFKHPVEWLIDSPFETRIDAGLQNTLAAFRNNPAVVPAELLMSISAEPANGKNPLSILSEKEPEANVAFRIFPESLALNDRKAAHSAVEVTVPESGATHFSEQFAIVEGEDVYFVQFTMSIESVEANAPIIASVMDSLTLTGINREAILDTIIQDQGNIEGGEIFVDSIVTGTIETGIDYFAGLGARGTYLIAAVANRGDLVVTIASTNQPDVPLVTLDNAFAGQPEAILWSPPADGSYTISVRDFAFEGGQFALTLNRVEPLANSLPIIETPLGKQAIVYVEPAGNEDVSLALINSAAIPVLLTDKEGVSSPEVMVPIGLAPGGYELQVNSNGVASTQFTTTVAYVSDQFAVPSLSAEFGVASLLATNSITDGVTGMQQHYITVEGNRPHVLIANATGETDAVIRVRNLDGSERLVVDDYSTGEIETRIIQLPVGSYIVEVTDFRDNNLNYVVGFYEFFPSAGETVEIDLRPELDAMVIAQPSETFDVVISAEDVNYNQIANRDGGFNGAPETFILQAGRQVPKGIYVARAGGFENSTGSAQLGVIYVNNRFGDIGNR